ncbi:MULTISPECIES: hypothetical protein [unclassified Streptomyces]|uniref:hypothetical protein n=1 Tax=unclassified Streptomyces TaxID=2593676 RepID=UPI002E367775|nr:hypothetical protein [Streptomyces sp. NBC_01268]
MEGGFGDDGRTRPQEYGDRREERLQGRDVERVVADGIPDFWAMYKTGNVRFYRGGRTSHQASYGNVIQTGDDLWTDKVTFG